MNVGGFSWTGNYDGEEFKVTDDETPIYPGFYKEENKRISVLGDRQELDWVMTKTDLAIKTPEKQGKYAYVFKIE